MNLLGLFENPEKVEEFQTGDIIFEESSPGKIMYVILEGKVDISVHGRSIDIANPGDVIGEMALIDSKSRSATAIAKADCTLVPLEEQQFLSMIQQTPFFAVHVMRILADRLRRLHAKG